MNGVGRSLEKIGHLMSNFSAHEQKILLYSIIRALSKRPLSSADSTGSNGNSGDRGRGGVAALLAALIKTTYLHQDLLVDWLAGNSADAVSYYHNTHRAVIAALSLHTGRSLKAHGVIMVIAENEKIR